MYKVPASYTENRMILYRQALGNKVLAPKTCIQKADHLVDI